MTTLDDLLRARHSCRGFRPDAIPESTIVKIVETAQRVPSWCNAQPWQLTITGKDETVRLASALYDHALAAPHQPDIPFPSRYAGLYKERRRECGFALYDAVGIEKGDRAASTDQMRENFRFFGAPHMALITTEVDLGAYGLLDCGAFITGFTLAAQTHGIASIPQAALAGFSPFLRDWFDIPDNRQIVCGISFGLADLSHPVNGFRTTRADHEEVISFKN